MPLRKRGSMRFEFGRLIASLFVVASLFVPRPAAAAPIAHLTLQSEDGDYIGGGGSFDITYTPSNSMFFFPMVSSLTPVPSYITFLLGTVTGGPDNTFAILAFSTNQLGIPIQPGFYSDAQRAPFADPGHPGLDISFQNRGCNTLEGSFLDVSIGLAGAWRRRIGRSHVRPRLDCVRRARSIERRPIKRT